MTKARLVPACTNTYRWIGMMESLEVGYFLLWLRLPECQILREYAGFAVQVSWCGL
jgi:hypothetical protein